MNEQDIAVEIQHVTLSARPEGDFIEVIYTEERDVKPKSVKVSTLVIEVNALPSGVYDDFMDELRNLLDEGLRVHRLQDGS